MRARILWIQREIVAQRGFGLWQPLHSDVCIGQSRGSVAGVWIDLKRLLILLGSGIEIALLLEQPSLAVMDLKILGRKLGGLPIGCQRVFWRIGLFDFG